MKIKDSQIKAILAEVEQEVGALLKNESDKLAKAAGEDEAPAEETPGEAPAGPDSASPEAPADESAAPAPSASPDASASPEAPPAEGSQEPGAEAGPVDPEALKAEYSQLPPEELKVHFLACKAAMAEVFGGGSAGPEDGAGTPPPGPEGSAPAAPPMAPPAPQAGAVAPGMETTPPAMKSEKDSTDLVKAEELEDLKRQVELMTKAVTMVLGKPERRAVTGVSFLGKGESVKPVLTKAEIQAKLSEVIKHPSLKKSDRERIVSYSYGNIGFEQIQDLLEKA